MTPRQLVSAIARSTGESLHTVRRMGFSPFGDSAELEPEDLGLATDCPFCGRGVAIDGGTVEQTHLVDCSACDVEFDLQPGDVYAIAVVGCTVGNGHHFP